MSVRVLLVDDHGEVRRRVSSDLAARRDFTVVGEADSGRRAIDLALHLRPDVVVMDITMADVNGLEATREIVAEAPEIAVVALSMQSDRRFVTGMLEAGARGYVLKDSDPEELIRCLEAVVKRSLYLDPRLADVKRHSVPE